MTAALIGVELVSLTRRDRLIVLLARRKLAGANVGFPEAVRALREAVEESIPAGGVFLLGEVERRPIIGSIVSGAGIVEIESRVMLARVTRSGDCRVLGPFSP